MTPGFCLGRVQEELTCWQAEYMDLFSLHPRTPIPHMEGGPQGAFSLQAGRRVGLGRTPHPQAKDRWINVRGPHFSAIPLHKPILRFPCIFPLSLRLFSPPQDFPLQSPGGAYLLASGVTAAALGVVGVLRAAMSEDDQSGALPPLLKPSV